MKTLFLLSGMLFSMQLLAQTTEQTVTGLSTKRTTLESVIEQTPYKEEQHRAIDGYFKGLNQLALDVKTYSNTARRFSSLVSRMGVASFCERTFLDGNRWSDLMRNCTRNAFFLCAEEVRAFDDSKETLKAALSAAQRKSYDETPACQKVN